MKNNNNKHLLFVAISTCFLLFVVEGTSYLFYVIQNATFNFNRYEERLGKATGAFGSNKFANPGGAQSAIHPYLGYTPNPEVLTAKNHNGVSISDYGFIDNENPIHARESDEVLIAITGGSVAAWFFIESRNELELALRKSPAYKSKKLTFINLAAGGYKQPQQLLSLAYLLSLGADFDIVVNIDGFNDLVMPIFYNLPKSVNPFYPTNWYVISQITNPGYTNPIIDKVKSIEDDRILAANYMKNSIIGGSIFARVLWLNYDNLQDNRSKKLKVEFQKQNVMKSSFTTSGPKFTPPKTKMKQYEVMAAYWAKSSKQIQLLANANDIKYFHFLQPNQYVPGSKVLSKKELIEAIQPGSQFGEIVKDGYATLQNEGALLKKSGVNFYDLTNMFKNNNETLYVDKCCHFNKRGLGILADKVAEAIIASK